VHATQGALPPILGEIQLRQSRHQSMGVELLLAPCASKKAAFIGDLFQINHEGSRKPCLFESHGLTLLVVLNLLAGITAYPPA
jgi:hypothetical protein